MISFINACIIILYGAFLIHRGVGKKYRFASWHMFNKYSHCKYQLYYRVGNRTQTLNPWDYLPHTMLSSSEKGVEVFLLYLKIRKNILVAGQVEIRNGTQNLTINVEESNVVDRVCLLYTSPSPRDS